MKKKQNKQIWATMHWLGEIKNIGTEKEVKAWCKKNQLNPKHPIYYAIPLHGVRNIVCDKCQGKGQLIVAENVEKL